MLSMTVITKTYTWTGQFQIFEVKTLFLHEIKCLYWQPDLLET